MTLTELVVLECSLLFIARSSGRSCSVPRVRRLMRVVCTQQLVWTLLSLLRESYLSTHRSVLHVLLNDCHTFFMFIYGQLSSLPSLSLSLSLSPQPILSEAILDQYRENKRSVPPGMTPDKYLEVMVSYIDYYSSILCSPHLLDLLP